MIDGALIAVFVFGLIFGSFLNVVIYRYDDWLSIAKERSACRHCQRQLGWYELVPLLSFVVLRGKCRTCHRPISWQYPFVELLTGLALATLYYRIFTVAALEPAAGVAALIAGALFVGAAIVIVFHDLYEQMVPDLMAYLLLIAAVIYSALWHHSLLTVLWGLLVGVAPIALLVYPSKGKWMGEGDVKIAAAFGAFVGFPNAVVFLVSTFLIGGLYGAVAMSLRRARLKTALPFVPFMALGAVVAFLWGDSLVSWYLGILGIPTFILQ